MATSAVESTESKTCGESEVNKKDPLLLCNLTGLSKFLLMEGNSI